MSEWFRDVIELTKELGELNDLYFKLSCEHDENADKMSKELNECVDRALCETYRAAYERLKEKVDIELKKDRYAYGVEQGILVPRTWRRWWNFWKIRKNTAAKLCEAKIMVKARKYFRGQEEEISREEALEAPEEAQELVREETPQEEPEPALKAPEAAQEPVREETPQEAPGPALKAPEEAQEPAREEAGEEPEEEDDAWELERETGGELGDGE